MELSVPATQYSFRWLNFRSAAKQRPITYTQRAERISESDFFAWVKTSLLFFALTAYFFAKYTRNQTTTLIEIPLSTYSTVHVNRMLDSLGKKTATNNVYNEQKEHQKVLLQKWVRRSTYNVAIIKPTPCM